MFQLPPQRYDATVGRAVGLNDALGQSFIDSDAGLGTCRPELGRANSVPAPEHGLFAELALDRALGDGIGGAAVDLGRHVPVGIAARGEQPDQIPLSGKTGEHARLDRGEVGGDQLHAGGRDEHAAQTVAHHTHRRT